MPGDNANQAIDVEEEQPAAGPDREAGGGNADSKPSKSDRKRLASRRKKLLLIAGVLLALVGAGYYIHNALRYEDTDDAQVDGHVMPLSAKINGQIQQVYVIEGQLVHAGDVLVVIDPKDYKVASLQAQLIWPMPKLHAASSHFNVPITSASAFRGFDSAKTAVKNAEAGVDRGRTEPANPPKRRLSRHKRTLQRRTQTLSATSNSSRKKTFLANNTTQALRPHSQSGRSESAPAGVQPDEQAVQQVRESYCKPKTTSQRTNRSSAGLAGSRSNAACSRCAGLATKGSAWTGRDEPQLHHHSLSG